MMERIPEPELMDSGAQTQAYAEADFSDSNSLFVDRFISAFPNLEPEGRMIDLGCGPADICIRLANKLPGWRLTGLDAGENMLRQAAFAVAASGHEQQIELRRAYLPDDGLPSRAFDAVISNSLLHHLPDPATLWRSIAGIGKPGAAVTVMDLLRPPDTRAAEQLVDRYAEGAPDVLREDFYNSLLAAYTLDEIRSQLDSSGLGHLRLEQPSDRHWLVSGMLRE